MGIAWKSTRFVGVRYREHPLRKHRGRPDRYYTIRYRRSGKLVGEATGWASHGMNTQKSHILRAELVQNIREGKRPQSLAEKRQIIDAQRKAEEQKKLEDKKSQITFGDVADKYLEWAKTNKKDYSNDESRYKNHLKQTISSIKLPDIDTLFIEKLKSDLQKKALAPKTVNHCLALIRAIYIKSIEWNLYSGPVPTKGVKFPKNDNRRIRFLSHQEANSLLNELGKVSPTVRDQAIIALHCGLRFGEIAGLKWADIDLDNGIINIRDPKSVDSRPAFMTKPVKAIFLKLRKLRPLPNSFVFPDKNRKKQTHVSNTFYRAVAKLGFNDGITDRRQKLCFHSLRHTFASWLAIQGESLFTIKELMGHKSITMTERYSHLIPDVKRKAVEDLARTFDSRKNQNS